MAKARSKLVSSRPLIKEPTAVEAKETATIDENLTAKSSTKNVIQPPAETDTTPKEDQTAASVSEDSETEVESGDKGQPNPDAQEDKLDEIEMAREASLQKLIDSKKYELPIETVENRRSKRVVALGIVLSIILALAWVDVALDAGLINISGVKPLTHFF